MVQSRGNFTKLIKQFMKQYEAAEFNLPAELKGLSAKQIEVHLGLYKGYVTHVNKLGEHIKQISAAGDDMSYAMTELNRRLGFEFGGMRMHEYYFEQFENGAQDIDDSSTFGTFIKENMGGVEGLKKGIKMTTMSRGIGWTILYWDTRANTPQIGWVSDHELGTLAGLPILLAIDMWEHAFMVDYMPAEKEAYVEAVFSNLNWSVVEARYDQATK